MRDGLTSDGVFLVVQGEDNLGEMLEPPDWGIGGLEGVSCKEDEVNEGTELHCPVMAVALGVLTQLQAEVESQDNQVRGVSSLLFGGSVGCGHNGMDDSEGVSFTRLTGGSSIL